MESFNRTLRFSILTPMYSAVGKLGGTKGIREKGHSRTNAPNLRPGHNTTGRRLFLPCTDKKSDTAQSLPALQTCLLCHKITESRHNHFAMLHIAETMVAILDDLELHIFAIHILVPTNIVNRNEILGASTLPRYPQAMP